MKGIKHLLFWSCELLFLHFISINLVLFLQRFCNISRFTKMNSTTTLSVSVDYTDSYAAPATSARSFPSEFSLHFVPSLLLFHFSAFWPSVPSVWIPATPTFSQLSEPFFFPPFTSLCGHASPLLSPSAYVLSWFICAMNSVTFSSQSNETFQNSDCHFEAQLQADSVVGCTGDVSHTDQGKCGLCLMINRWRQESTLLLQAQNLVMYSLSSLNVSSYHFVY